MKTKLLSFKTNSNTVLGLLAFGLCFNYGWSQNLILNGSCDEYTNTTSDNADAFDMTPNSTVVNNAGTTIPSPYSGVWKNDDLETYLETTYNAGGDVDEQPGSTGFGAGGTRGMKLYMDTSPSLPGVCTRRIYQKVVNLTIGHTYTFNVDSRSEAAGVPSEVFILNSEITTEAGLDNGLADSRVDGFVEITNDFNTDEDVFVTSEIKFTATTDFVVVYIRASGAVDEDHEVFYDNFSLVDDASLSVDDHFASEFAIYPNPVKDILNIKSKNIEISAVSIYNLLGKNVYQNNQFSSSSVIDLSSLNKGVYLLKIEASGRTLSRKLVVQ